MRDGDYVMSHHNSKALSPGLPHKQHSNTIKHRTFTCTYSKNLEATYEKISNLKLIMTLRKSFTGPITYHEIMHGQGIFLNQSSSENADLFYSLQLLVWLQNIYFTTSIVPQFPQELFAFNDFHTSPHLSLVRISSQKPEYNSFSVWHLTLCTFKSILFFFQFHN